MPGANYYCSLEETASQHEAILVVDIDRRIISWNRKFIELCGINASIIVTLNDKEVLELLTDHLLEPVVFLLVIEKTYTQNEFELQHTFLLKEGICLYLHTYPLRLGRLVIGRIWKFSREISYTIN